MVDLRDMFRRKPPQPGRQGFARSRADITVVEEQYEVGLEQPVRDAPPVARRAATPRQQPQPQARQSQAQRRATTTAHAPRTDYLAVHGIEKSFGSRQVVRGVSIYVRRGEAVGLLGHPLVAAPEAVLATVRSLVAQGIVKRP